MKISIILGTRPEIIKCSPIIRECEKQKLNYFVLHTGQHYSYNMDKVFFEQLNLPDAKYNLDVGSGSHGKQTGDMLKGIEEILIKEAPDVVLVQGDTNTVLAGAIAATKLGIKVGHVEAGLRSYDRKMPEEINRVLADHCSDFLFAPTETSKQILLKEGIPENKIFSVGNTVVDAVFQNLKIAKLNTAIFKQLSIQPRQFMLATSHRQENVDDEKRFRGIIEGLQKVREKFKMPIIYPIHPRAKKQLQTFGLDAEGISLVEPLDYLTFLVLESEASLVLTDSGGVQEETCILQTPCVTLRDSTERPETLDVGSNMLAGTKASKIMSTTNAMFKKNRSWTNPFGDGKTSQRIISILLDYFE
jgi:UDP-N-acetylglucosamine 2-epimerase (non-hydrolysing)